MYQHSVHYPYKLMCCGKDCHLVGKTILSPFIIVDPEEFIGGNDSPCHKPDDSSEMPVPLLADPALSLIFA